MDVSTILVVIAVVLFALAAFENEARFKAPISLIAAGLFFWALSTLL